MATQSTRSRAPVRRLAVARLISITGGAAAYLTLNYTIYKRTGSATWVAAALFLTFGTTGFVSPFAGALGDRFDRRRVMIASDVAGAASGSARFVPLRGTSFAAPLVAAELATRLSAPDTTQAARAVAALAQAAIDLGTPGRDPIYGFGLVGEALRNDPERLPLAQR